MKRGEVLDRLEDGSLLNRLKAVYGESAPEAARRLRELMMLFAETFPVERDSETILFSTPGRTEICGNHTDHQHGHGMAASVNLDTIACVVPNGTGLIRIKSLHHRLAEVDTRDLGIHREESGTSVALVRGAAARIRQMGYPVGGFDAYTTTRVLRGSGLSSSAAFEVLTATVLNEVYCRGELSPVELAKVGQYAENVYFGKPCGLLDQLSCAVGGVIGMDFRNPDEPAVEQLSVDLQRYHCALCIVDTRASHSDLTEDYAAIPLEMRAVADCFGREVLIDVEEQQFLRDLPHVRAVCGDRAVLRAYHFFQEEKRVAAAKSALREGNFRAFLEVINASGLSSAMYLQNVCTYRESRSEPILFHLALAKEILGNQGAVRVHGGGFAGTIQAYVPLDRLDAFVEGMEAVAGKGTCHILSFRDRGTAVLVS